jgi:hypothetical protein
MRDRHFPRLCRSCQAPMARQADGCWHCGTPWATEEEEPATITRLPVRRMPALLAGDLADGDASLDVDRWANDGGTDADQDRAGADQDRAVIAQRAGGRG